MKGGVRVMIAYCSRRARRVGKREGEEILAGVGGSDGEANRTEPDHGELGKPHERGTPCTLAFTHWQEFDGYLLVYPEYGRQVNARCSILCVPFLLRLAYP